MLLWGISKGKKKPFRPYDTVMVIYDPPALPLLEALHKKLVTRRMNVVTRAAMNPSMEYNFLGLSDKKQRQFISPGDRELYRNLNGYIFLHAPASLTHLKDIEPSRINDIMITRKKLREILNQREAAGSFNWTLCTYPTEALAKQARATMKEYAAQIIRACYLNDPDPVKQWNEIYGGAGEVKDWLNSLPIKTLFIESASMEMEIDPGEKRRFVGVSGRNIPSFEIFTSPDWRGVRGHYYADMPSFRNGNYVEGVRLYFEKGVVAAASAKKSEAFLLKALAMDRGASRVGEFSLTDKRFSRINRFMADTLFDENYGGAYGNCHIALGSSYDNTYRGDPSKLDKKAKQALGYNDSALHWDLVNTENKTVTALLKNGKKTLIYEKGMFRY
ncbi:MAG TPA: aminopeptidase [Spirochaetes bacterium]|nr:aminopeptidase [Spirochaetota bacterium]